MSDLVPWSVRALNLAEHADNVVHTDAGAIAAGYPRALVAGTTVYAYLSHVPATGWGPAWLAGGGAEVRFRAPVYDDDLVELVPVRGTDGVVVEARVAGDVRATLAVWPDSPMIDSLAGADPKVDVLPDMVLRVGADIGGYGTRAGDDLALYAQQGIAHPAIWPVVGNRVTMANLVTGPWIHVRSRVQHYGVLPMGSHLLVESSIARRYSTRAGARAVLAVRASIDGELVATIEHESIIELAES